MRGSFEKIIGKTITNVYCRDNKDDPEGQIFLIFDDNTYYEIYAYGSLKGASGLDKGYIKDVIKSCLPPGDGEIF